MALAAYIASAAAPTIPGLEAASEVASAKRWFLRAWASASA
jgi:hypothetical protein